MNESKTEDKVENHVDSNHYDYLNTIDKYFVPKVTFINKIKQLDGNDSLFDEHSSDTDSILSCSVH